MSCRFPGAAHGDPDAFWRLLRDGGRRRDRGSEGPLGLRRVLRSRSDRCRARPYGRWGAFLEGRPVRSAVLRHRAARGRGHRSAAAPAARDDVGSAGGCRHRRPESSPAAGPACSSASTASTTRRCSCRTATWRASTPTRCRAARTVSRPAGSRTCSGCRARDGRRYRLLVVAGRDPPGLPEPAQRRLPDRACRRRPSHAVADELGRLLEAAHAGTDGRCKTFDARGDGFVEGEGCAVLVLKRLSDAVADGDRVLRWSRGIGGQPGRREQRTDRAERAVAGAVIRAALAGGGDSRPRWATSRRTAPGPRSAIRSKCRRWRPCSAKDRPAGRPLADRIGEDQHRAYAGGRRHCRPDQAGAGTAAPRDSADAALPAAEPVHSVGDAAGRSGDDAAPLGRAPTHRGSVA